MTTIQAGNGICIRKMERAFQIKKQNKNINRKAMDNKVRRERPCHGAKQHKD
jgi:hypothetical protein